MTKNSVALLLCSVLLFVFTVPVFSVESSDPTLITEQLENGDYIVYGTSDTHIGGSTGSIPEKDRVLSLFSRILDFIRTFFKLIKGSKTVAKEKYANYYDKNGILLWTVSLYARFTYTKNSAKCISAEISYTTYDSDWQVISSNATRNGNVANGYFSVRQTKLGVPLKLIERTVTLVCDANGNVT